MSEGFTLSGPAQVGAWVLISRRHQVQLHLKGMTQKGLVSALKRDIGDHGNRVANYVLPIEEACAAVGIENDWKLVNLHVMVSDGGDFYLDAGIFNSDREAMEAIEGLDDEVRLGRAVVVLTQEPVRGPIMAAYTMEA